MASGSLYNFDYLLKYILIGDNIVGKSALLTRYTQGEFDKNEYDTTIGVEFGIKKININNKILKIEIWDCNGSESFLSITRTYYNNSVCALIVYDISSRNSFKNITKWINGFKTGCPKTCLLILVGNKCDLNDIRQVTEEEGKKLADENDMMFFETSAKNGFNVQEVFLKSANEILKKIGENYYDLNNEACGIIMGKRKNLQFYLRKNLIKYIKY